MPHRPPVIFAAELLADLSSEAVTKFLHDFGRLAFALACGAAIGWERERKNKAAGLKTHALVSIGAALVVMTAEHFMESQRALLGEGSHLLRLDLLRVIAGIIGGVGFLGAGAIIQGNGRVSGLTTAATIWVTSAIGIAAGLGEYVLATTAIVSILLVNVGLKRIYPEKNEQEATDEDDTPGEIDSEGDDDGGSHALLGS